MFKYELNLVMPVDHDGGRGEDGAIGEGPDLGKAALVGKDPVELGDALLVDAVLQILGWIFSAADTSDQLILRRTMSDISIWQSQFSFTANLYANQSLP